MRLDKTPEEDREAFAKHFFQQFSSSELWHLIHEAYGEELGLTSDDDLDYSEYAPLASPSSSSGLAGTPSGVSVKRKAAKQLVREVRIFTPK